MTSQNDRAETFRRLHVKGSPLVLFNAWDAGSAQAVARGGAAAIATGSWSVAGAHGFGDGEKLPLDLVIDNIARVVAAVDLPVSLDFEGGYARAPRELSANLARVIGAGAVGINLEDQVIGGEGFYSL
jgi:2-methylisocitrate lyase-like PEP mutase family enzyme